jgi:hypothetical protein
MLSKLVLQENTPTPMVVTLLGMTTLVNLVRLNAPEPIIVTLSGMVTFVNPVSANAPAPISVMFEDARKLTSVILVPSNAPMLSFAVPTSVTGRGRLFSSGL